MADTTLKIDYIDNPAVPIKAFDNGDGTYSMQAGTDATNDMQKTTRISTAGALTGAANGATVTGVGKLRKLIISNGSGSAITVNIYDNTSATGTKLMPQLNIPTLTTLQIDNLDVPFSLGVFIAYSTATSCDGIGYYEAA